MSEVIAALLGGLIAIIGYFAIIETIGFINQRRFFKLIESRPPRSWMPDEEDNNNERV